MGVDKKMEISSGKDKLEEFKNKAKELEKRISMENFKTEREKLEQELEEVENKIHRLEKKSPKTASQERKKEKNFLDEIILEDKTPDIFALRPKGFARKIIQWVSDSVYKGSEKAKNRTILELDRLIKKTKIVYHQFWADKHQEKISNLKAELDTINLQINDLKTVKKEMKLMIGEQKNISGIREKLEIKIQDINKEINKLLVKKDKIQGKIEKRENKMKLWINKRDNIAEDFINQYESIIQPLIQKLEEIHGCRDQVILQIEVIKARHDQEKRKINELINKKISLEKNLKSVGLSVRKISQITQPLEHLIEHQFQWMENERKQLIQRKEEINKSIADLEKEIFIYQDKINEFARIQHQRPLNINLESKKGVNKHNKREEIKVYYQKNEKEKENPFYLSVSLGINQWNEYLKNSSADFPSISVQVFSEVTGLSAEFDLELNRLLKILKQYYQAMMRPVVDRVGENRLNVELSEFKKIIADNK